MKSLLRLLVVSIALFTATAAVQAQSLDELRQRMEKRLPDIDALKSKGAVGENNKGMLEPRDGSSAAVAAAAEENKDRTAVYAALAKRTGSTPEAVAQARAKQIIQRSAPGVWVQRENGEWYRK